MSKRKILISPDFGAGWTTWESRPEIKRFMLEYAPIIEFLEAGGSFDDRETRVDWEDGKPDVTALHPILRRFALECQEKFGSMPYMGGARDLEVVVVDGPVRINEYDGSESLERPGEEEWL